MMVSSDWLSVPVAGPDGFDDVPLANAGAASAATGSTPGTPITRSTPPPPVVVRVIVDVPPVSAAVGVPGLPLYVDKNMAVALPESSDTVTYVLPAESVHPVGLVLMFAMTTMASPGLVELVTVITPLVMPAPVNTA